jgi:acyl carrier protein
MTREEIEKITNGFLVDEIEINPEILLPESSLKNDLGIDSLDFVDIVVIVEHNFKFKIKAEEMASVKTLKDFYDYLETKVNESNK